MTVSSMTGFALARRDHRTGAIVLEIRSVNSRYLDPQFRLSDELRAGEASLREAITAKVARGKLDVRYYIHRNAGASQGVVAADRMLAQLDGLDRAVRARLPDARPLSVSEVLHWPGVLESGEIDVDEVLSLTKSLAGEALAQLATARGREGERLAAVIVDRIAAMEAIVLRLAPAVPRLVEAHQQKLEQRLGAALGIVFDAADASAQTSTISRAEALDRIRQEITLYGTRIDVSEELARLSGHLAEVRAILGRGGAVGKRLDFMMQELNREANTLGSKAATAELADAAVELKLSIEQIREQVQNLE
jgi:uncharacterized protein (TIGR00255 family)